MNDKNLIYSDTDVTSAAGVVSIGRHTDLVSFLNTHATIGAEVKLNGGPHTVLIPPGFVGYTEVHGDFVKFEIMTADVTLAVMVFG